MAEAEAAVHLRLAQFFQIVRREIDDQHRGRQGFNTRAVSRNARIGSSR